ncbi:MAG: putative DNA binding domain-containing protein [Oscillospiraceae bacterium]|nr:putative DNA binding domain-containing protein [Oscillospiraceae bacterium]
MLQRLIVETTECDFKRELEKRKPKSWLKSVSAFANGIGGTMFFGVANDNTVIGLTAPQSDVEFISARIKERISPVPDFIMTPYDENGKTILALVVHSGRNTPYYYAFDGIREAYIRMGSESVPAPDYMLNELILKGTNRTYDTLATEYRREDYSFTLLEATYRERTKITWEQRNYISFGLETDNGYLTRAGSLLTDQHIVYNSRVFCTRWNGLNKGSIFDDALDDKEFEGNLIYLLQNGCDFIKINSKVRFAKAARGRIDKPDYSDRAAMEALVNALIHRDHAVMGAEVHIDMYDDRLEITSPGGMYKGRAVQEQDIKNIESERRNPILADLFHRMRYMERRGSGLQKIVNETKNLPGYTDALEPRFYSDTSFRVVIYNVNYDVDGINVGKDVGLNVGKDVGLNRSERILNLIKENNTMTSEEMAAIFSVTERTIDRDLSALKKQNKIKRIGSKRAGHWELIP